MPRGITRLEHRESFITADGSSIRELAGIPSGNAVNQSLAEATVPPGGETFEHFHRQLRGDLPLHRGGRPDAPRRRRSRRSSAGDTIVIAPGVKHKLWNPGAEPLILLCCCSPAYSHEDTVLLEGGE